MWCGTEAGSYLRLIDSCINQLKAQGPSRTCNESTEEGDRGATSNAGLSSVRSMYSLPPSLPPTFSEESQPVSHLLRGVPTYSLPPSLPPTWREIGILLPSNQRQHRTLRIQKDVLPHACPTCCPTPPTYTPHHVDHSASFVLRQSGWDTH